MSNPFFQAMGGGRNMPGPFGDMAQFRQKFEQFRQSFQGDPRAEVERMVRAGQVTQDQLNWAQNMARQLRGFNM